MKLLSLLTSELEKFQASIGKASDLLREAGAIDKLVDLMKAEMEVSYQFLKKLSQEKKTEAELEQSIRSFLKKRSALIFSTDVDYITFPHSPMNQLCVKLAQEIVKPDEPLLPILIPSIKNQYYLLANDNLRDLTEIIRNRRRDLTFSRFLLSEDGQKVIPIRQWFEAQQDNSGEFFNHLCTEKYAVIPLTHHELIQLQRIASNESYFFFEELTLRKNLMNLRGTLAEAVINLCSALHASGQHGTGTLDAANDAVYESIRVFALILTRLTPMQKQSVLNLRAGNQKFGYYWNIISGYDGQARDPQGHNCVELTAGAIRQILQAHPQVFSGISIQTGQNTGQEPVNLTPFAVLLDRIESHIKEREQALHTYLRSGNLNAGVRAIKLLYPGQSDFLEEKLKIFESHLKHPDDQPLPTDFMKTLEDLSYFFYYFDTEKLQDTIKNQAHLEKIFIDAIRLDSDWAELILVMPFFKCPAQALRVAIQHNNLPFLQKYLSLGLPIHEGLGTPQKSPLHLAVSLNLPALVVLLIRAGADCSETYIDLGGNDNLPLLIYAYESEGWENVVEALLARDDYQIDAMNANHSTCLHSAVFNGDVTLTERLLLKGADPNLRNNQNNMPIHLAVDNDSAELISLLATHNADLNAIDAHGNSPLSIAYRRNYLRTITSLIAHGANFRGLGIIDSAIAFRHREILCACMDKDPQLTAFMPRQIHDILFDFLSHVVFPKVYEKYIHLLVLGGGAMPHLIRFYRVHGLKLDVQALIHSPKLFQLKAIHDFEGLFSLCGVKEDSVDSLKIFVAWVVSVYRSRNDSAADPLEKSLQESSVHDLSALASSKMGSCPLSGFMPAFFDPWSLMPEGVKKCIKAHTLSPESSVSRKRTYQKFSG